MLRHLVASTITRLCRANAANEECDPDELSEAVDAFEEVIRLTGKVSVDPTYRPLGKIPFQASDVKVRQRRAHPRDMEA